MENPAVTAPAEGFFPSFLLLTCGTLLAALLGAAHRLGLFYQLMHKVPGHRREAGWDTQGRRGLMARFQLTQFTGGESESQLVQSDWWGDSF